MSFIHFSDLIGEYKTLMCSDSNEKRLSHVVCYKLCDFTNHPSVKLQFVVEKHGKTVLTTDNWEKALNIYNTN